MLYPSFNLYSTFYIFGEFIYDDSDDECDCFMDFYVNLV